MAENAGSSPAEGGLLLGTQCSEEETACDVERGKKIPNQNKMSCRFGKSGGPEVLSVRTSCPLVGLRSWALWMAASLTNVHFWHT